MNGTDIVDVRDSVVVRADIKNRVDTILGQFDW